MREPARRQARRDPNADFLGEQSQGGEGNHAGPELSLFRLVRWFMNRKRKPH